jgi:hypothetical protein
VHVHAETAAVEDGGAELDQLVQIGIDRRAGVTFQANDGSVAEFVAAADVDAGYADFPSELVPYMRNVGRGAGSVTVVRVNPCAQ